MLEVKDLRKTFGDVVAVDDVSFQLEEGTIMGLIGQNGSGKTTLFRMILDFLTPEGGGYVHWKGQPMTAKFANDIGYLPEERGLYEELTIENQIQLFGQLRGMDPKVIDSKIDEWMKRFNVKGDRKHKVSTLSKGNQQKVQVIATLIHEPKLIILDEPFSGLDPVNADYLKQGILNLRDKGSSIIFSSHNMSNVEEICDSLLMIHNGREVLLGEVEDVRNSFGKTRLIVQAPQWDKEDLIQLEGVTHVEARPAGHYVIHLSDESYGTQLFDTITHGKYIPLFSQQAPSLEEIFKMKAGESLE